MRLPALVSASRQLNPDAPACQPCPWPVSPAPPVRARYSVADHRQAAQRCAELTQAHPTWPRARVRATVARELHMRPVVLRYLLRQAAALDPAPAPDPAPV